LHLVRLLLFRQQHVIAPRQHQESFEETDGLHFGIRRIILALGIDRVGIHRDHLRLRRRAEPWHLVGTAVGPFSSHENPCEEVYEEINEIRHYVSKSRRKHTLQPRRFYRAQKCCVDESAKRTNADSLIG
jgi:hypothetical protein